MCKDPFDAFLETCIKIYQKVRSKIVETTYKIIRDEDKIAKKCERHKMTFWELDLNTTVPESRTNITLDVPMFTCPLTKMDLKFLNGSIDHELEDFYLTEGTDKFTVAVLRNSTNSSNICFTNLFKYDMTKLMEGMDNTL